MANYTTVDCLCFFDSDVIFSIIKESEKKGRRKKKTEKSNGNLWGTEINREQQKFRNGLGKNEKMKKSKCMKVAYFMN